MTKFHTMLKYFALAFIAVSALAYGSYPPWISGFAVAGMCVLGAAHVVVSVVRGVDFFSVERSVKVLAMVSVGWISGLVLVDVLLGVAGGRTPALSVRQLPYVFAFLSAAMLGASFSTLKEKRAMLWTFAGVGAALALLAFVQWIGIDLMSFKTGARRISRPSGVFISSNRLAVMLCLCISCCAALLLKTFKSERVHFGSILRRRIEQGTLFNWGSLMLGSLALTLSRLSVAAFAVSAAVAALLWARAARQGYGQTRLQRLGVMGAALLIPLAMLVGLLSFAGQGWTQRLQSIGGLGGRWDVLKMALPLFSQQPWIGSGLGTFETVFTPVQEWSDAERWSRLHWDWLQFAIEAGWPALLLLVATMLGWGRAWWRNLNASIRRGELTEEWIYFLIPMAGCATVMLCSIADFPLRETSLAFVFFFLAGNLAQKREAAVEQSATPVKADWTLKAAALPLVGLLGMSAFVAGRNGLACAVTPWRGQHLFPPVPGANLAGWERGIAIDPGDPALRYFLALGANQQPKAAPEIYEKGLAQAKLAMELSPRDYLIPWTASTLAEKLNRLDEADALSLRAISLFPQNLKLKQDRGLFFLRQFVANSETGSLRRAEGLEKATEQFRSVMRVDPSAEETIKSWMAGAGSEIDEVTLLWEGGDARDSLARAKYLGEQGQWEDAAREIKGIDATQFKPGEWADVWHNTLSGSVAFQQGDDAAGIDRWKRALTAQPGGSGKEKAAAATNRERASFFMMTQFPQWMRRESLEKTASGLAFLLKDYPAFTHTIATQLHYAGKNVEADQLLRQTAGNWGYLYQVWAHVALALNDDPQALKHAYKALQLGGPGVDYKKWHADFVTELELRRSRRKEKAN